MVSSRQLGKRMEVCVARLHHLLTSTIESNRIELDQCACSWSEHVACGTYRQGIEHLLCSSILLLGRHVAEDDDAAASYSSRRAYNRRIDW